MTLIQWNLLTGLVGLLLLLVLLFFETRGFQHGIIVAKPLLSLLFVVAAWHQPTNYPLFAGLIGAALAFCLLGDVCLIFKPSPMFLAGLVFFLLGHLIYVAAFATRTGLTTGSLVGALLVLISTSVVYRWLRPRLGRMKKPVVAYMVVISLMVTAAATLLGDSRYPVSGRLMVLAGASAFYVSDIFVARDRFLVSDYWNRLVGLPLYYAGQFLLAFSIGAMG